jgi:hypothetical protein
MLSSLSSESRSSKFHQTSAGPEASIGRWKNDLPEELQSVCDETFGDALLELGYV